MLAAAEETVGPLAKAGAAMEEMQIEAVANAAAALEVIEAAAMTVVKATAMAQAAVRDKKTAEARAVAMEIRLVALDAALNEATGTAAAQAVREDEQQVAVAVSDLKKRLVAPLHAPISSPFQGVSWRGACKKWVATKNRVHIGYFDNEEDAAQAVTDSIRQSSMPRKEPTSKFRGVGRKNTHAGGKMWEARISNNNKRTQLGYFQTEELAALAYNAAVLRLGCPESWLNNVSVDGNIVVHTLKPPPCSPDTFVPVRTRVAAQESRFTAHDYSGGAAVNEIFAGRRHRSRSRSRSRDTRRRRDIDYDRSDRRRSPSRDFRDTSDHYHDGNRRGRAGDRGSFRGGDQGVPKRVELRTGGLEDYDHDHRLPLSADRQSGWRSAAMRHPISEGGGRGDSGSGDTGNAAGFCFGYSSGRGGRGGFDGDVTIQQSRYDRPTIHLAPVGSVDSVTFRETDHDIGYRRRSSPRSRSPCNYFDRNHYRAPEPRDGGRDRHAPSSSVTTNICSVDSLRDHPRMLGQGHGRGDWDCKIDHSQGRSQSLMNVRSTAPDRSERWAVLP